MINSRKSEPERLNVFQRLYRFLTRPRAKLQGISLFRSQEGSIVYQPSLNVFVSVGPSAVRFSLRQRELMTSPFLFVKDEVLYCFFGTKNRTEPGKISVLTIGTDRKIRIEDCCLDTDCHLSFPFIYSPNQNTDCFMIPETTALREVAMYEPIDFPLRWTRKKVLLTGHYVDSHLLFFEETYYLFATQVTEAATSHVPHYQLNIFYSDTLLGDYLPHPRNPVCIDQKYSRSGGKILLENGIMYRIAHDCSETETDELHFFRIAKLTKEEYEEEIWLENWSRQSLPMEPGASHVDTLSNIHDVYTAVEVTRKDSYLQRFVELWTM